MENLAAGIKTYGFFVNWTTVDKWYSKYKDEFHLLDALLAATDKAAELDRLLTTYPRIALALPSLFAERCEGKKADFNILTKYTGGQLEYEAFEFSEKSAKDPVQRKRLIAFARDIGILDLYQKPRVLKSTPDYAAGVEVGSDTNGRKNRGGKLMETVCAEVADRLCAANPAWKWMPQASAQKLSKEWGVTIPERYPPAPGKKATKASGWRPDLGFLVNGKLWLAECNFYNSQGSKLKATAGEYEASANWCKTQGIGYVWITDGKGWETSEAQLQAAFKNIDYTLSLKMCSMGCLEDILKS